MKIEFGQLKLLKANKECEFSFKFMTTQLLLLFVFVGCPLKMKEMNRIKNPREPNNAAAAKNQQAQENWGNIKYLGV